MKIRLNAAIVSLLTITLFAAAPIEALAQSSSVPTSPLVAQIIARTNADRDTNGKARVIESPLLDAAAQRKANDMLSKQYFSHVAPDGTAPWAWFKHGGYPYIYAGENLAMNFYSASDVETAWMNSPAHRANVLNSNFKEIGIGVAHGVYQGKETTLIVEFFGTRK
ncbi:MAG TPA: CAP domain-containing protein [Candidatus Paceibacterota bacterium]|nr:CAP domain-containing protein [Candidatus Paceibacterota bacterium]